MATFTVKTELQNIKREVGMYVIHVIKAVSKCTTVKPRLSVDINDHLREIRIYVIG